jgi:tRNA(Ile)-lysidine synthase
LACHVVALQEAIGRAGEGVLREARRSALCELAAMRGASWIALGHQRDDLVETMVMRLLRDAGVDGLGGIPAVSPPFVRPLSGRTRAELRALLRVLGVSWFEDPTNDDASRLRARVRHRVLPVLRRFDPGIDDRFVRLAGSMRALGTGLRRAEDEWVSRHAERWGGGVRVSRAVFAARPPVEVGRWVRCLAEAAGVPARRMGRACIEEVRRVIVAGRGEVPLPCGRTASCDEAWVLIGPRFHDSARLRLVGPGGTC